ncbi:hypothetical protein [Methanolobus psychrotolerans]|uniref:hypothetical protein n=1 Tax=Methanolobus psychrotolerans TaxID=1874706 RepID=UPI000B9156B1|nr:hypothetical protein [Methanolobus psychrotolerans]
MVPVVGAVADARDAVQALINGDKLGAAFNAAGAFSGIGDAVKVGGAVGLFVTKYPSKVVDIAKVLAKHVLPYAPELVKIKTLDAVFDGAASALKSTHYVPTNTIMRLADAGVDLKRVQTLLSTMYIGKWSPGRFENAAVNLNDHFMRHGREFGLSGDLSDLVGKQQYVDMAVHLINKRQEVEIYYNVQRQNMLIYHRTTKELVIGNVDGEIQSFRKNRATYIDTLVNCGTLVNLME